MHLKLMVVPVHGVKILILHSEKEFCSYENDTYIIWRNTNRIRQEREREKSSLTPAVVK